LRPKNVEVGEMDIQITNNKTLVDILRYRAENQASQIAYTFLKNGEVEAGSLTYQELDLRARSISSWLQSHNLQNERAILIYPYDGSLEFIAVFMGCLYAGVIAVPCHPPRNRHAFFDLQARLTSCQAKIVLTQKNLVANLKNQFLTSESATQFSDLLWLNTDEIPTSLAANWYEPKIEKETLAFLQYTSGSTGMPKGVIITHECILYNQEMLRLAFGHTEESIGVSWLPLFHDMGLIGNVLQALYLGRPSFFLSPISFIQKPIIWLQAISRYKATTSGAPNFAYDLLCRYVTPQQRDSLDLSSWEVAFSGAEPIRVETIERFVQYFSPCGFRREAFYPCYGMAEATLLIAGGLKTEPPVVKYLEEEALAQNIVVTVNKERHRVRSVIGCGRAWLDEKIVIVDPQSLRQKNDREIGEIWVSGSGIGKGYWQEPEKTADTFQAYLADTKEGPFMRTGDLGFLDDGQLFVTGRLNDVMVFWGFNHYPQLIEETVEKCHPALRSNCVAAFAVEVEGEDRLAIAAEIERNYRQSLDVEEVGEAIRWAIFQEHFLDIWAIDLLKTGSIPKTSSGKIQRSTCKAKFLEGSLEVLGQWRSPEKGSTIISLVKRYLNPITYGRRYLAIVRGRLKRILYFDIPRLLKN
jgi:acyl-CoA synthetase (AMP-forming)/AMP-acid ligase II